MARKWSNLNLPGAPLTQVIGLRAVLLSGFAARAGTGVRLPYLEITELRADLLLSGFALEK